jgi:hypothetical protein
LGGSCTTPQQESIRDSAIRIANTVMVEFRRGARVEALRGIEREAMI